VAAGKTYEDTGSWTNSKVDDARLERFRENLLQELKRARGADGSSDPVTAAIAHIARHSRGSSQTRSSSGGRFLKTKVIEGQCRQGEVCKALLISRAILETHDGSLALRSRAWEGLARPFHARRRELQKALASLEPTLLKLRQDGARVHADAAERRLFHDCDSRCDLPRNLAAAIENLQRLLGSAEEVWGGKQLAKKTTTVWLDRITFHLLKAFPGPDGDKGIARLLPDGGPAATAVERVRARRKRLVPERRPSGRPPGRKTGT
jgi:hypothetical protein